MIHLGIKFNSWQGVKNVKHYSGRQPRIKGLNLWRLWVLRRQTIFPHLWNLWGGGQLHWKAWCKNSSIWFHCWMCFLNLFMDCGAMITAQGYAAIGWPSSADAPRWLADAEAQRGGCEVQRHTFCTTAVIATQYRGGGGIRTEVGQGRSEAAAATLCFVLPAFHKL